MAEIKPEVETLAKIKVVGVGGSGGNTINRMADKGIRGVEFIAMNTDVQALHRNKANKKLHIGKTITRGLGAGMNPEIGRQSAEETQNEIRELLKDADMVFVTCGMGGGTGTGAAPIVADIAKDLGALTIAVVTKPFSFEGAQRRNIAERGLAELTDKVDAIITIPNDRIFHVVDKKTTLLDAFNTVDDILRQGVQGIAELITSPGDVNMDFADVKAVMANSGSALMGIGSATGENRAIEAAKQAVNSPLLETSIEGARGILLSITHGPTFGVHELQEASKVVTASADEDARIIFGTVYNEKMKDEIKITVVATGFDRAHASDHYDRGYQPTSFVSQAAQPVAPAPINHTPVSHAPAAPAPTQHDHYLSQRPKVSPVKAAQAEPAKRTDAFASPSSDDDDELGIPAFIRKKMM